MFLDVPATVSIVHADMTLRISLKDIQVITKLVINQSPVTIQNINEHT